MLSRLLSLSIILGMTFSLGACKKAGEDNNSSDANGNCTASFAQAYNEVIVYTGELKAALGANPVAEDRIQKSAINLKLACKNFFDTHKSAQCVATKASVYQKFRLGALDLKPNCQPATEIREKSYQGKPSTGTKFDGNEKSELIDIVEGPL